MSSLPNLVLTNAGATLLAKSPIGSPIPVTKWQIGTGVLPDGTNLRTRTKLVSVYTEVTIARVENSGNECLVTGNFVNKGYGAFTWTETGLFAQDPDVGEILYAYGNAGSDGGVPIPAGTTQYREVEFGVQLVFDVASNVTSTVSQSMIYATRADLKTKADLVGGQVPYAQTPHIAVAYKKNIYVDAALGDDTNSGTQEKPFRTIQTAVDSLPKDLGPGQVCINVAEGVYNENVSIVGFWGGAPYQPFILKGTGESNKAVEVGSIAIANCTATIRLQDLSVVGDFAGTASTVGISSAKAEMANLIVKQAGNKTVGISVGANGLSQGYINNCVVDGYPDAGITSVRASVASIVLSTVKNCAVGIKAYTSGGYPGIAMVHSITYTGNTVDTQTNYSGQIFGGQ